jgi:uncharacterized membrane protein
LTTAGRTASLKGLEDPMRLALIAPVVALAVAACSEPAPAPEAPPPASNSAVLAGVRLDQPVRVLGTEPFWGVDITPSGLTYSGVDRPEQIAPNPGPTVQGTTATWETTLTDGTSLAVMLIATECSDGMSDRVYPLTARVEVGDEGLNGCAIAASALNPAG